MNRVKAPAIYLFGLPAIAAAGPVSSFPDKGFQVLALLALAAAHRATRKSVASMLWDDVTDEVSLGNLRQVLSRMRKSHPPIAQIISSNANELWLTSKAARIDVCQFLGAGLAERLTLYRGDLLAADLSVSNQFRDWLLVQRSNLQNTFLVAATSTLQELTRYGRAQKPTIDAIAVQMLAVDPLREGTYRSLIESYGRAGHFEEAAARFEALNDMLSKELDAAAQPETLAVVRRVFESRARKNFVSAPTVSAEPKPAPRIAFLAPQWISADSTVQKILNALIEDIANELARYRTFVMLAPHSSFQVEHDTGMLRDNSVLRADFTISGFVKPGEILALRMVGSNHGEIAWAGDFAVGAEQILTCFGRLSRRIAGSLALGIERELQRQAHSTSSLDAYMHYLNGQSVMQKSDLAGLRRARRHFKAAANEDSKFSSATARIAQTLYEEWLMTGADDTQMLADSRHLANRAIDMDPNNSISMLMNGVISLYQRNFEESERNFEEAEALAPNSSDVLLQYGDALACLGSPKVGLTKFKKALELNPMPPEHYWWVGASIAGALGDHQTSLEYCQKLENDEPVVKILACAHGWLGNKAESNYYARRVRELFPNFKASDVFRYVPDRTGEGTKIFMEGLRMAGIK